MHRTTSRRLLAGLLALSGGAALTGLSLDLAPAALLAAHLVAAAGAAGVLIPFLAGHWWARRESVSHQHNAALGYFATAALGLLAASGIALLWLTNVAPLRTTHNAATYALVLILGLHSLWRIFRRVAERFSGRSHRSIGRAWRTALFLPAILAIMVVVPSAASITAVPPPIPQTQVPIAHAALAGNELPPAGSCAGCHTDATQQWRSSLHAQAVTDEYYLAVATLFIEERGVEAVRYCAACHNPVGLMRGEVDVEAAQKFSSGGGNKAYESRALGVHLPLSDAAAEGVTCAVCHLASETGTPPNNGNLALQPAAAVLPESAFGRLALRAAPDRHKAQVMPATIADAALCGACHNVYTEDGMPLEPTYDEWLASPYPSQGKTCQTCHMPDVQARRADSGLVQAVPTHGGIPGAPSSLPDTANDAALLRKAAELALDLRQADDWRVTVSVTNRGAGHKLPTGAADLRQVWLEVTLRDASGLAVWQSGGLDAYGALTPDTIQFRKVLGDAAGKPVELHRFWVTTQILSDTSLQPLETRQLPYRIPTPDPARGPFTVTARLLYRDVSQSFAEFALNRPAPDLPIYEMAHAELHIR